MSPRIQFGLDYLTGSEDFRDKIGDQPPVYTTKASASGMAVYGWARYFTGNSFNFGAGLGQRTASLAYGIEDRSLNITLEGTANISSIIVPVFFGNQWMWDGGFTIGVDWLEAMIPISGSSSSTTSSNVSDPGLKKLSDDTAELGLKLAKTTTLTLFLTSIGWTF